MEQTPNLPQLTEDEMREEILNEERRACIELDAFFWPDLTT